MGALMEFLSKVVNDSTWSSSTTGFGTSRDKSTTLTPKRRPVSNDDALDSLYDFDDMAARLVSAKPEGMFSRGFDIKIPNNLAQAEATNKKVQHLGVIKAFVDALIKRNVIGGAAILVGVIDNQKLEMPVNYDGIREIAYLTVLDRRSLQPLGWYDDPLLPNFGKPKLYSINPNQRTNGGVVASLNDLHIHASRLLIFDGLDCSNALRQSRQGWGQSLLDRGYESLQTFASNWLSIKHLLTDASQGIWTVPGVWSKLLAGQKDKLLERFELADMAKSIVRSILLDEGEKYERLNPNLSGYADLLASSAQRLAATGQMPVTVLMGISPAGLNATGENDIRNWYDALASERMMQVEPLLHELMLMIFLSKQGPTAGAVPDGWKFVWPPLWQSSPKEKAEVYSMNAAADCAYVNAGVFTHQDIAFNRQTEDGYQAEIEFDAKGDTLSAMKAELDAQPDEGTAPAPADVQAQALNGSQIASLKGIVVDVAESVYPSATGVELILISFPNLTREQASRVLSSVVPATPAPALEPKALPSGAPGQPTP